MTDKQKLNYIETAYWIMLCLLIYIGSSYVADMDSFLSAVPYGERYSEYYSNDEHPIHFEQYRYFALLAASWCIGSLLIIYNNYRFCRKIDSNY